MIVTLVVVLIALGAIIRRADRSSPMAMSVLPAPRITSTSRPNATRTAATSTSVTPTPTDVGGASDVAAARRIEELGRDVGQIRELPKQQEVPLNFLSGEELAAYLRRIRTGSERRAYVQRQQALLAALGLSAKPGEAFPPTVLTRAKQVLAFYDPAEEQIFLGPSGWATELPDISLVHQYAHAYIDQHFDLLRLISGVLDADAVRARDALLEGDAMAVLAMHDAGSVEQADLDELAAHLADAEVTDYEGYLASRAMSDVFAFPYREGTRFVEALLDAGWWPAVNAAYLDPPVSTEQILHPEKYIDNPRDEPRTVLLPDIRHDLDEEWTLVTQNVLGELILRAHLDQYLPDTEDAVAAAEGWDGDLAALWRDAEGNEVLVIRTVWDDLEEAAEFGSSYVKVIDRRLGSSRRVIRSLVPRGAGWWRGEKGDAYLQRDQDTVLIVWAPNADLMEQVLEVFVFGEE